MNLAATSAPSAPPPLPLAEAGAGKLSVSEFQERLLDLDPRLCLALCGGRGGAKSRAAALLCLVHLLTYGPKAPALWLRKSHPGTRDAVAQVLETFTDALGPKGYRYNANDGLLRLPNGGTLEMNQLAAVTDWSKYQGRSIALLIIDEAQQWATPSLLDKMRSNLRAQAGVPTRMVVIANPGDNGHGWIAKRHALRAPWTAYREDWIEGEDTGREWVTCPSTLEMNPFIDAPAYRRELAAACAGDPALLAAWVTGDWSSIAGCYFNLTDANALPELQPAEWKASLPKPEKPRLWGPLGWIGTDARPLAPVRYFLTHDWGSSKPSVTFVAGRAQTDFEGIGGRWFRKGSYFLLDEVATNVPGDVDAGLGLDVPAVAALVKAACERWEVRPEGTADDAIFQKHGHSGGSIAQEFARCGVTFYPAGKGGRVAGWEALKQLIAGAAEPDRPGFYASRNCKGFWETAPFVNRDKRNPEDVDSDGPDHWADAARYGAGYEGMQITFGRLDW